MMAQLNIQNMHFMNTVLNSEGICLCAKHSFLEIWVRVVNPVLNEDLN